MLDVNKITSVLAKLPDAALQQYAAMHKQDPYILSLAVEESNRRKEMRAAPQMMQGQQPPVNDQAVQAMLPEDTGIARLPMQAPPVTHAAHGGIISFADAGAVPSVFTYLPEPIRRRLQANAVTAGALPAEGESVATGPRTTEMPGMLDFLNYLYSGAKEKGSQFLQQRVEQHAQDVSDANMAGPPSRYAGQGTPPAVPSIAVNGATPPVQPPPPRAGLDALSGATGAAGASYKPMTQAELIQKQIEARKALSAEDPARTEAEEAAKAAAEAAEKRFAEYQAALPKGKAYEGLEASVKKEEADLPQKKEENLKMALLNAGLGMMAGTSRYAMVNIGEGGKRGAEVYQRGLDKLDEAAKRRQELTAKIEEARRAETRGDAKDAYSLRKEVDDIKSAWRKDSVSALRDMFKVNDAAARNIVDNIVRQESIKGQYDIAAMHERGAAKRADATLSAHDKSERAQQLRALSASRAARLSEIQRDLAIMPTGGLTPEQQALYKNLIKQRDQLTADMQQLEQHFAKEVGIPATSTTTAPPRAPDYRFDAKGNLIR